MTLSRIICRFGAGSLLFWLPVMVMYAADAEKVTAETTAKTTDYPTLCRMAEANRDWTSAWGFAEKWAAATDPAVRRAGVVKLLELALRRESPDFEKLTKQATDAGLSPEELIFWHSRVALKQHRYQDAEKLLLLQKFQKNIL